MSTSGIGSQISELEVTGKFAQNGKISRPIKKGYYPQKMNFWFDFSL